MLIGEAAQRIEQAIGARIATWRAGSMQQAVDLAFAHAQVGDAVVLSPACSSYDMFKDYIARGEAFCNCVKQLRARVVGKEGNKGEEGPSLSPCEEAP